MDQPGAGSQGGIAYITAVAALVTALAAFIPALFRAFDKIRRLKAELAQTNAAIVRVAQAPNSPDTIQAVLKLGTPPPEKVGEWALQHHAKNAWDMGPKNWERCLFDLGYEGGKKNEPRYDENDNLIYQ